MNTQEKIIVAGLSILERDGPSAVTRDAVADAASVAPASVSHHFGSMEDFRNLLMQVAVDRGLPRAVAWGLVAQHPVALMAPWELRRDAAIVVFEEAAGE